MAFNPSYALDNEIFDLLGGLLDLSNSNNTSVNMPLWQAKLLNTTPWKLVKPIQPSQWTLLV